MQRLHLVLLVHAARDQVRSGEAQNLHLRDHEVPLPCRLGQRLARRQR
jgi:hypothetical protein